MPQIRDEHGQLWVVTEQMDVDWAEPRIAQRDLDDFSYATLSFRTADGRKTRMLRHVASLDWRSCSDEHLLEWLRLAEPVLPGT